MQLNIRDFEPNEKESFKSSFNNIPENMATINVFKKGVQFEEPINKVITTENANIIRPREIPKISYEDIMSKMGMFVANGKLHLMDNNQQQNQQQNQHQQQQNQYQYQQQNQPNIPQNSYIYNKLFKEELRPQNEIKRPMTAQEYKKKVLENFIQSQRIREMKSRKLLMPTSNINISSGNSGNLNKLFNFSKR